MAILGIALGVVGGDLLALAEVDLIFPFGWALAGSAGLFRDRNRFRLLSRAYRAARLDPIEALRFE